MRSTPAASEKRENFYNGSIDWENFHFGHMAVELCQKKAGGDLLLTVSTPNPVATDRGLRKYKSRWDTALRNAFEQAVSLTLCARAKHKRPSAAKARMARDRDDDLVPLASVFEMWHAKLGGGRG
jgi:hypothetical protein